MEALFIAVWRLKNFSRPTKIVGQPPNHRMQWMIQARDKIGNVGSMNSVTQKMWRRIAADLNVRREKWQIRPVATPAPACQATEAIPAASGGSGFGGIDNIGRR